MVDCGIELFYVDLQTILRPLGVDAEILLQPALKRVDTPAFDTGVGVAGERLDPDRLDNEHNSPMHDTIAEREAINNPLFGLEYTKDAIFRGLESVVY